MSHPSYKPFGVLLPIDRHSLPVLVNLATHLVPERNFVHSFIQNMVRFHTGTNVSHRYENGVNSYRYDLYRHNTSYRYYVNENSATNGYRNELVPE